ncbi:MAG: prephenate dehydratase domain-containing protein [Hyphomicrobiales bacterium]
MKHKISFQGEAGANSHIACMEARPDYEPLPCRTFEDAFQAVEDGTAELAMIPTDNSVAGRVADIHHLLPHSSLSIVGEHFLPVHHQLLVVKGVKAAELKSVHSHVHALGQCRKVIRDMGLDAVVAVDTAGAARELAEIKDRSRAAIATRLAGDIYGLEVLRADIEDESHNTTRFVVPGRSSTATPDRARRAQS